MSNQQIQVSNYKLSFLQQLRVTYSLYKKCYQEDKSLFGNYSTFKEIKKKNQKTRSKSKKDKLSLPKPVRKSSRFNLNSNSNQIQEVSKEPLWQIKKRKESIVERKPRAPILTAVRPPKKITTSNPLYEFYSESPEDQREDIIQKRGEVQMKEIEEKQQVLREKEFAYNESNQNQQEFQQEQIENWVPSKQEKSMLAIQKIIDEYLLFKLSLRSQQVAKLSELINYVRQIKGYYFTNSVLADMLSINNKLYKTLVIDHEKYIRSPKLSIQIIEKRQLNTKIRMKRNSNQQ